MQMLRISKRVSLWIDQILSGDPSVIRRSQIARSTRHYATRTKTIKLTLDDDQYALLQTHADRHGLPLSVFAREAALAYSKKIYLVPEAFVTEFRAFCFLIRNGCNNLNQIAHKVNATAIANFFDAWQAKATLAQMEKETYEFIANPPLLHDCEIAVEKDPILSPAHHLPTERRENRPRDPTLRA